jgi:hypothetical protein
MDKHNRTGRRYSAEEKAAAVRMVRTLRVELCFGNDDPHYEKTEWAKWWQPTGKRKSLHGNPVRPDRNEENHLLIRENGPS